MGDDDDVWVLDKMTVTGSNSNGGGGGIFIHYSGRGVRPPPVKHMPDSPTLPPGLSYQGGFPEFFGISDVDPLSELVGSDALTTQLGFEVTDSSGVNLDALRDTVPQVTDSFSSDGYASAMKTNPATVMRMLAPAPNGTPRTRAPNNAGGGYWSQVGSYFGNYMLGVAESPWTLLKGVGRGYAEIGGLVGDATTGQFWRDLGTMATNPGATAVSTVQVGAGVVTGTVASFADAETWAILWVEQLLVQSRFLVL